MSPGIYYATVPSKNYTPIPIIIGDQVWDARNLDTAYYRDGSPIQYSYTSTTSTIGAWYWYDSNQGLAVTYGKLYNWWAVNDSRNIAPVGWRVATTADWDALATYLGGASIAGNKLKQSGTTLWQSPNGGTNSSGFTALPGGLFNMNTQGFENINQFAYFRTSTNTDIRRLQYNSIALTTAATQNFSFFSVRLIKIIVELTTNATSPTVGATATSLSTGGNISNLNGFTLTSWGVCYSNSPTPTTNNNTVAGSGTGGVGSFNSTITALTPNTTYYIKAYVITTTGETFYGQEVTAITTGTSTITTTAISGLGTTSATSGGTITSSNSNTITQSGICWSTSELPTTANAKTTDGQTGIAPPPKTCGTGVMTSLLQNTQYYVRAYVTTTADTTYGDQVSFTTNAGDVLKASYSLRQTVSSYLGAAIRVRRTIGANTVTADVNFNTLGHIEKDSPLVNITGTTTATTLGQFIGASGYTPQDSGASTSTVFVQTWYDQSGNAKNVNQTTTNRQPTIAVSGVLNIAGNNNRAALRFTRATSTFLGVTDSSLQINNTQVYTVCNSITSSVTTYNQIAVGLNSTNRYFSGVFGVGTGSVGAEWLGYGTNTTSLLLLTPASAASQLFYSISNATGINGWLNNTDKGTYSESIANTVFSASINIGSNSSASAAPFNGFIQEVQIYTPSLTPNRLEVTTNINQYYNLYTP